MALKWKSICSVGFTESHQAQSPAHRRWRSCPSYYGFSAFRSTAQRPAHLKLKGPACWFLHSVIIDDGL